jgi:hypothetical protein
MINEDSVAEFTLRLVLPEILPEAAAISAVPAAAAVARPLPLIVATPVLEEVQVTREVISWVEPSE